jgi:16S rRNA (guanine527-N7)-methyltransferase
MNADTFLAFVREAFPFLTEHQEEQFSALDGLYREWNEKINVISRKDIDNLYAHHVLHSLAIARYLQEEQPALFDSWRSGGAHVLDLGTGGGFPGIPLAILFPQTRFTLCDSIGKKTLVAREVASALGLQNVEVVNARAETLGGGFDFVVSRAVASLSDFYPWVKGKYTQGILYLKGGDVNEEISALMQRFPLRKGSVSAWPISSWLEDEYFAGKFVINIL